MKDYPNLLLIAGTGTKSGKTTMICKLIRELRNNKLVAIKITPHFHETTEGLVPVLEGKGYAIYRETNGSTIKDTSRMVAAGASEVYFAKVWDDQLHEVFNKIWTMIPKTAPVICESPALRSFIEPGLFIIMTSGTINKHKDISHLEKLPHLKFRFEDLENMNSVPVGFSDGKWQYLTM